MSSLGFASKTGLKLSTNFSSMLIFQKRILSNDVNMWQEISCSAQVWTKARGYSFMEAAQQATNSLAFSSRPKRRYNSARKYELHDLRRGHEVELFSIAGSLGA